MENVYFGALKMLFVLAAMVAGIIILYRYSDKLKLIGPKQKSHGLQKVDTLHLGYRKFISVVEVKDHVLVVGVGDKEVTLLAEWKKEDGNP